MMRAVLNTWLQRDVNLTAAAVGVVTFVTVRAVLKRWFRPLPNGPNCYWIQRRDSPLPRLLRWVLGDLPLVFLRPAGSAHVELTNIARERLGHRQGHAAFFAGGSTRVLLSNVEDVRHIFVTAAAHVEKAKLMRFLESVLGRYSLVTVCEEDVHDQQFRYVSHAFGTANIKHMATTTIRSNFAAMTARLHALVEREGQGARSVIELMFDETGLAIISEATFRTRDFAALRSVIQVSLSPPNPFMMIAPRLYARLPLPRNFKIRRLRAVIADTVHQLIQRAREDSSSRARTTSSSSDDDVATFHNGDSAVQGKKLIDLLAENPALTDEMILDHTITFVLAGHETTANALNWTVYHVSRSKHVQDILFEELSHAFALGVSPAVSTVSNLPYLRAVCDESLRCNPPVSAFSRETTADMVLPSGTYLPKGTVVVASPFVLHSDVEVWGSDADVFRPERWIEDPDLKQKVTPCSFMPFAAGKRACIGKEFAMHELLIGIAMLFRNFEIRWPADEPAAICRAGIVTRPKKRFPVQLYTREA
jgi:cytochrome P450